MHESTCECGTTRVRGSDGVGGSVACSKCGTLAHLGGKPIAPSSATLSLTDEGVESVHRDLCSARLVEAALWALLVMALWPQVHGWGRLWFLLYDANGALALHQAWRAWRMVRCVRRTRRIMAAWDAAAPQADA